MLKPFIAKTINRTDLSADEAQEAMNIIMTGQATPAQIGAYLVALRMKGETVMRSPVLRVPSARMLSKSKLPTAQSRSMIRLEQAAMERILLISLQQPPLSLRAQVAKLPSTATAPRHPDAEARMCLKLSV